MFIFFQMNFRNEKVLHNKKENEYKMPPLREDITRIMKTQNLIIILL